LLVTFDSEWKAPFSVRAREGNQCGRFRFNSTAGAIILKISYGYDVKEKDDPFVDIADRAMKYFSISTTPGVYMVDLLPACKSFPSLPISLPILILTVKYIPCWMPGAGFKKAAEIYNEALQEFVNKPYNMVKEKIVRSECPFFYISIPSQSHSSRMPERRRLRSYLRFWSRV
jgi:hypothetical protein